MGNPNPDDDAPRAPRVSVIVFAAVIAIVLFVTLVLVKPAMPDRVVLLTGPEGSAYHDLGTRYGRDLRRRGLDAEVVVTGGALDNLRQLANVEDAVAFAPAIFEREGDIGVDSSSLVALGSVDIEPLWVFYRAGADIARLPDLAGKKVVTGGPETLGDHLARTLLEMNGIASEVEIEARSGQDAAALVDGLTAGSIDAVFVTGPMNSPIARALLDAGGVRCLSFDRAEAYAARLPGLMRLVAPEGVFDLERNLPRQEAQLLAAATCLVAQDDLHPAVVPMLLLAAEHGQETSALSTRFSFPSRDHVALPLDGAARRYFSQGETGLSRFLPYNVTRFLNHLGFFVLPLLTVMVVLLKVVPMGLRIWSGLRLKGYFKRLEAVEKQHASAADRSTLLAELD
ncbi:MAG: TAXI family TRAP transporter solute-binding subunit, partial [Planctomycetota bacterium]